MTQISENSTSAESDSHKNSTSGPEDQVVQNVGEGDDARHDVVIVDHDQPVHLGLHDPLHHGEEWLVLATLVHPLEPLVPVLVGFLQRYVEVRVCFLSGQVDHIKLCVNVHKSPLQVDTYYLLPRYFTIESQIPPPCPQWAALTLACWQTCEALQWSEFPRTQPGQDIGCNLLISIHHSFYFTTIGMSFVFHCVLALLLTVLFVYLFGMFSNCRKWKLLIDVLGCALPVQWLGRTLTPVYISCATEHLHSNVSKSKSKYIPRLPSRFQYSVLWLIFGETLPGAYQVSKQQTDFIDVPKCD